MTLKEQGQKFVYYFFDPIVRLMHRMGLSPNNITTIGFIINILAAVYLIYPYFLGQNLENTRLSGFGLIVLGAGLMDMLDGRMARLFNLQSTFGAFYDSVIDRYSEIVMYLGFIAFFIVHQDWSLILLGFASLTGSLMVSYSRARAEGLRVECSVGFLQRPERIILFSIFCTLAGLTLGNYFYWILYVGLGIIAVLSNYTALQRIIHVKKSLRTS